MEKVTEPHRCFWCNDTQIYRDYHDTEWGFPVVDDTHLFEKVCLEGFQSGLSWLTILRKREHFRAAFCNFDISKIARFNEQDVNRLMADADIVRHQGKIKAAINNAQCAERLLESQSSLADYFWQFVGPTTMYAFMQAMGLVNDHEQDCYVRGKALDARLQIKIPT